MAAQDLRLANGTVYFHSAETMKELKEKSVRFAFGSPPFTNHPDGKTLDKTDYLEFIDRVYGEVFRVLVPGGVLVTLNTDSRDHKEYNRGDSSFEGTVWHKSYAIRQRCERLGFKCFDQRVWVHSEKINLYRYTFSTILFLSKPGAPVLHAYSNKGAPGFRQHAWIVEDSMQRRDSSGVIFRDAIHPEIVKRCVDEFSRKGDLVLSPFVGSGTVCAVAERMQRPWVGYEVDPKRRRVIEESVTSDDNDFSRLLSAASGGGDVAAKPTARRARK